MPRRRGLHTEWKSSIDALTAAKVERILTNNVFGKPQYGARSKLIEKLLQRWLLSLEEGQTPIVTVEEIL